MGQTDTEKTLSADSVKVRYSALAAVGDKCHEGLQSAGQPT